MAGHWQCCNAMGPLEMLMRESLALGHGSYIVAESTIPTMIPAFYPDNNPSEELLVHTIDKCSHTVSIENKVHHGDQWHDITPVLMLSNDDDGYYSEVFRDRSELNVFIDHLQSVANELWPSEPSGIHFHFANREVARFTEQGFFYKEQFIEDAGEAHRLLLEVLNGIKSEQAFV
jgi:hypothetical protein